MDYSLWGTTLLAMGLAAAGTQASAGLIPGGGARSLAIASAAAAALLLVLATAFGLLMMAYATTDLSLLNVFTNSHSLKPLAYKISGTWGNHEGSLLLWLMILAGFGAAIAFSARGPWRTRRLALGVQGLLSFAFVAFTLATSSPFEPYPAAWPTPFDGQGLNPLLQDPGLAIHPPTLYVGYVGLSAVFSFTIAALLQGQLGADWAKAVRPFLLVAWSALTLGIGLGAFWAYYELGWGGFWFWDPVENASLMPWLASTALFHCVMVVERRDALKPWCAALAILAFGASLLGTFLVRSGIVTSVHAFANDPERGLVLLFLAVLFTGGGFVLFAWRGAALSKDQAFEPVSREGALVINNLLLSVLLFTVFLGTFWPTVVEVSSGSRISVGPPYYNMMSGPLAVLLAGTLAFGLLVPWRRPGRGQWQRPMAIILGGSVVLSLGLLLLTGGTMLAAMGLIASLIVFGGVAADLARRAGLPGSSFHTAFNRLRGLTARQWGSIIAHSGIGLLLLGITVSTTFQEEIRAPLKPGESLTLGNVTFTYEGRVGQAGANFIAEVDRFTARKRDKVFAELTPSRRYYPAADQATTEVAIKRLGLGNLYLASGAMQDGGDARVVRAYHHPMIHVLWGGALLIALGGLIAALPAQKPVRVRHQETQASGATTA
ncbi:MAG: heme lyase CcmF/NrfE family subunit [Pseudomonadota bacterium]